MQSSAMGYCASFSKVIKCVMLRKIIHASCISDFRTVAALIYEEMKWYFRLIQKYFNYKVIFCTSGAIFGIFYVTKCATLRYENIQEEGIFQIFPTLHFTFFYLGGWVGGTINYVIPSIDVVTHEC